MSSRETPLPRTIVLVGNQHSGHIKQGLQRATAAIRHEGLELVETIHMHELERLRDWVGRPVEERPLIVAAGGDGTVGAVANYVVDTEAALGIVPLGTSNDVARSLGIPVRVEEAVHIFTTGKISTVDAGRFETAGRPPRHFVHAAAMGLDVAFARLATQVSLRKRLGRLTYVAAAFMALRHRQPFTCRLEIEGRYIELCLLHLSVINAPIFGGLFGLHIVGSSVDDRRLDVLAVEDGPLLHLALAAVPLLLGQRPHGRSVRLYHVRRMRIHTERPVDVSLDGEVAGRIPGDFVLAGEALRVMTPQDFEDVDDAVGSRQ